MYAYMIVCLFSFGAEHVHGYKAKPNAAFGWNFAETVPEVSHV